MDIINGAFKIGQYTDVEAMTGCTVILSEKGAVPGVSVRGGSPNTRDTDALRPENNRKFVHGVVLSGGSAYGLSAGDGVVKFLEEKKIGRDMNVAVIPNVVGASLFDLKCGSATVRPDSRAGYLACVDAFESTAFHQGNYGAGTGAAVGGINGRQSVMKAGIGYSCIQAGRLSVAAVIAVNAVGDIYDEETAQFIAGARSETGQLGISEQVFLQHYQNFSDTFSGNTVIGCVMTNATLDKARTNKLADISHNGIARAVRPAHTTFDGDALFALCSGEIEATFESVAILSVEAVRRAIVSGVKNAETYEHYLSYKDYFNQ